MGIGKIVPNIKVNYTLIDIFRAFFIPSAINRHIIEVEESLKKLLNVQNILLTSSGRSALYHVLSHLYKKKVIVPAYTCDVVVEAAILAGKEIFYAHVNRETLNVETVSELDCDCILIATHQYGFPCKIKEICDACKQKGAVVIEDCAGAFATDIDGQMAGTFGDFAIFSFNASKLINAPSNGGFLIAKNDSDMKTLKESLTFKPCTFKYKAKNLCKSLAFCLDKNGYVHYWLSKAKATSHCATNAHISAETYNPKRDKLNCYHYGFYNWQAYVVLKQLKRLPYLLKKREKLANEYREKLSGLYQKERFDRHGSCIRYPIYLDKRKEISLRLKNRGVEIGFGFSHFVCPDSYSDEILMASQIVYLPYSSNFSNKEIDYIINCLNQEANEQSVNS